MSSCPEVSAPVRGRPRSSPSTPRNSPSQYRTSTPACTTPRSSWAFRSTGRFSAPNHSDLLLHRGPLAQDVRHGARGSFARQDLAPGGGNMWARPRRDELRGIAMTDQLRETPWYRRGPGRDRWLRRPMPGPLHLIGSGQASLRVVLRRSAWDDIEGLHAAGLPPAPHAAPARPAASGGPGAPERAGLLAGRPCVDDRGPFILIEGVVPAPGVYDPDSGFPPSPAAWDELGGRHAAALPRRDRRGLVHRPTGQGRRPDGPGPVRGPPLFPRAVAHHLRHRPRPGEAGSVPLVRRPAAAAARILGVGRRRARSGRRGRQRGGRRRRGGGRRLPRARGRFGPVLAAACLLLARVARPAPARLAVVLAAPRTELYSRNGTIAARTDHAPVPARGAAARRSRPGRGPAGSRRRARPGAGPSTPAGPRGRTGSPGLRSGPGRCGRRPSGRGHGHGRGRGAGPGPRSRPGRRAGGYVVRPGDTLWSIARGFWAIRTTTCGWLWKTS